MLWKNKIEVFKMFSVILLWVVSNRVRCFLISQLILLMEECEIIAPNYMYDVSLTNWSVIERQADVEA
ncbi:hypothetical protein Hanom_Chr12g01094951 [Helianthus anomalus]